MTDPDVYAWIKLLDVPDAVYDHTPVALPCMDDNIVSIDDISEYLFGKGVASHPISNLVNEIGEFVRIENWYKHENRNYSPGVGISNPTSVPIMASLHVGFRCARPTYRASICSEVKRSFGVLFLDGFLPCLITDNRVGLIGVLETQFGLSTVAAHPGETDSACL